MHFESNIMFFAEILDGIKFVNLNLNLLIVILYLINGISMLNGILWKYCGNSKNIVPITIVDMKKNFTIDLKNK